MLSFLTAHLAVSGLPSSPVRPTGLSFDPGLKPWGEPGHCYGPSSLVRPFLLAPWRVPTRFKARSLGLCFGPKGCFYFKHHHVEIDVSFLFNWYHKQNSVCELKFMGLWKSFVKKYSFKYFLRLKFLIYFFTYIHFILHRCNISRTHNYSHISKKNLDSTRSDM